MVDREILKFNCLQGSVIYLDREEFTFTCLLLKTLDYRSEQLGAYVSGAAVLGKNTVTMCVPDISSPANIDNSSPS